MITIHHLNNSRSQRVLWLLEELGEPYEIKHYQRNAKTMLAPPELKAIHPLGKSPVLTEGDITIAESGAIIEYIVDTVGQGRLIPPPRTPERLRYTYWLHYAEGSAMPLLVMSLVFGFMPKAAPTLARPLVKAIAAGVRKNFLQPQLDLHFDYIESELGNSEWFAGSEFSAADIQMSFPLEASQRRAGSAQRRPNIAAFLERIHARPAYQRALAKGGPYELMG